MPTLRWRPLLAVLALALTVPVATYADDTAGGLKAEYFANETLAGSPAAERVDATVDFAWEGTAPAAGVPSHEFSVRWSGVIKPRYTERYTLHTRTDDGVRLWIDDKLVIDDWNRHAAKDNSAEVDLVADRRHRLRMEFYEHQGRAEARLSWQSARQPFGIVPAGRLAPATAGSTPPPTASPPPAPVPTPAPAAPAPPATDPAPGDTTLPVQTQTTASPAQLAGAVKAVSATLPMIPAAPDGPLAPPGPPVAGDSFNAAPLAGEVRVRRPEDGAIVPLEATASLPVGTRIDAREGAVALQTAPAEGVESQTQFAAFEGATFEVTQPGGGQRMVGIALTHGNFETCTSGRSSRGRARTASTERKRRVVRRLFGTGKGRFRTKGRFAAATVRGTSWTVADTCGETIARVHEGVVDVRNLVSERLVTLRAGDRYAARAPR